MLASMSWPQWLLSVVLIFVCLFLMLVILLQRGRGGGISSAFGGGGGSGAFGAKTGDVFTWITVVVAGIFVVLAVAANFAFDQSELPVTQTVEEKPELIPIQMGEDGQALPINIEQLPAGVSGGIKDVTITPTTVAPDAAAPGTPAPQPVAPSTATPPPPAGDPPAEKPAEEPATP